MGYFIISKKEDIILNNKTIIWKSNKQWKDRLL